MPNAVQSEIAVVNTVNLKITDKQYFATLANKFLVVVVKEDYSELT
jgi:hypothetical protein